MIMEDEGATQVASYEFRRPDETSEVVSNNLHVIDQVIQQFLAFQEKVTTLDSYEAEQSELARASVTLELDNSTHIQEIYQELDELREIYQLIRKNTGEIRDSKNESISYDLCTQTVELQRLYIEKKAYVEAKIGAIKARSEEQKQHAYKNLVALLQQHGGIVLKGSTLAWLVDPNGILVRPYNTHPERLNEQVRLIQRIVADFISSGTIVSRFRALFPKNQRAAAAVKAAIAETRVAEEVSTEVSNVIRSVPDSNNTYGMMAIKNRFQYKVRESIEKMRAVDTQSDRLIELYDGMSKRLSGSNIFEQYQAWVGERWFAVLKGVFGENPSNTARALYSSLSEVYDSVSYLTHDKMVGLTQTKVVEAWESVHGATFLQYQERIQKLEGKITVNDYSRIASILKKADAGQFENRTEDLVPNSSSYLEFFKQRFPAEAQLISEELAEMEQREQGVVASEIVVLLKRMFRQDGSLSSAFSVENEVRHILRKMTGSPKKEYFQITFVLLKKLGLAPHSYFKFDTYRRLMMLALGSKSQMDGAELTKSHIKIWTAFMDLHCKEGEVNFLSDSLDHIGNPSEKVIDERCSFFSELEEDRVDFDFLLSQDAASRFKAYKQVLGSIYQDTLVAETLLRHELSFEEQSSEAVAYLTEVMEKNRSNQDKKCKKVVPPPHVMDLVVQHPRIDSRQRKVISELDQENPKLSAALALKLYGALNRQESIDWVMEVMEQYLSTLSVFPKKDLVKNMVEEVTTLVAEQDIYTLLSTTFDAMRTNTVDAWLIDIQKKSSIATEQIFIPLITEDLAAAYGATDDDTYTTITDDNWKNALFTYIQAEADLGFLAEPTPKTRENAKELFKSDEVKAHCFEYVHALWLTYLQAPSSKDFPYELAEIAEFVDHHMGAGPLKYVTSLCSFARALRESYIKVTTADTTSNETFESLGKLERRFVEEGWSQKQIADFYHISTDILQTTPSLFAEFLHLFEQLGKAAFTQFSKENYPFYQARLVMLNIAGESDKGKRKLLPRDLVGIRGELQAMETKLQAGEDATALLEESKRTSLTEVKRRFQEALGITKVPEEISEEHIRSIQNNARYLANINEKTSDSSAKLALFLALKLNNKWDDFRRNKKIAIDDFFLKDSAQLTVLRDYMQKREFLQQPIQRVVGLSQEDMPEFWELLNTEDSLFTSMNTQSVDIKLQEILSSLEELNDPDAYEKPLEKAMLPVYMKHGVTTVNRVVAQSFQQLSGREPTFKNDADRQQFDIVQEDVRSSLSLCDREWNSNSIQELQSEMKVLSSIQKTYASIHEQEIPVAINALQSALLPSQRVAELFQKMGEDFNTQSGAIALSQDVDYLDNLVVKRGQVLSEEERQEVVSYLTLIREKIAHLEGEYNTIKQRFLQLSQSMHSGNPLLQSRIDSIRQVINQSNDEKEYTSVFTNDINVVIENIRACLGCLQKEINNDTNLAFGDSNKFFLMTKNSKLENSMSDQIVLAEPVVHTDGTSEIALVFDQLYGIRSADVFMNHVALVWKRYAAIKKRFPESKMSLFISNSSLFTAGLTKEVFFEKINDRIGPHQSEVVTDTTVNVLESAGSDPYIEFGGDARKPGERLVSGIVLR